LSRQPPHGLQYRHLLRAVPLLHLPPLRRRQLHELAVLRQQLLDPPPLAVPPARGLGAVSLGPLLRRRAAGEHLQRRSGRRDLQLLLVSELPPLRPGEWPWRESSSAHSTD